MKRSRGATVGMGRAAVRTAASVGRRGHGAPLATLVWCVCVLAATPGIAPAVEPGAMAECWPVVLGVGSQMWIEGTSTLRAWSSRTDSLGLALRVAPGTPRPANVRDLTALVQSRGVRGVVVDVPVRSLRAKDPGQDKDIWRVLRGDQFPIVRCELTNFALAPARAGGDAQSVLARGILAICGRERPIELAGVIHADDGGLWVAGSAALLMTDYGIRPPSSMFGTFRVADRVQVRYRLLLVPGFGGVPGPVVTGEERSGVH